MLLGMPSLDRIRRALAEHAPRVLPVERRRQAAVAVVLRGDPEGPEVLFIERARHPADPWSGHMAFPGGRVDPGDAHARAAAERETLEEVGLPLADVEPIGRLDDLEGYHAGRPAGLVISAWVYHVEKPAPLVTNHEVAEALWVPLRALLEPDRHIAFAYAPAGGRRYPGIVVGHPERHVVWGLTYRFLDGFFQLLDRPLAVGRQRAPGSGPTPA
jgi:8-oxo-dGTP pyrophosphatase MutT (NUDIX family)